MSTDLTLYEQLANELSALIAERVYAPGERLPSIRRLAQQKRLSISTVMQALRLLEDRGLIDAKPQAGYYVRNRVRALLDDTPSEGLKEPAFVGINNLLMRVLQANETPNIIQLGSAWPPDEMLPVKRIVQTVSSVARRRPDLLAQVNCAVGSEPSFIRQIVRRALDWGKLEPAEIVVTNSCTEAISLCLRAVAKEGDTIAVESATYFALLQLIESLGMKALEIPTHPQTGVSVDALELALREGLIDACLFVPNANNPLGCIIPDDKKKRLAELMAQYDVPLIEDDVYGDLCFTADRPWPVKAYDTSGNILLCSSFSKAVNPAAPVGYVVAGKFTQAVALLKTVTSGATSHFFQAVLGDFISGSSYDNQIRKMRRVLAQRIAQMSDVVASSFPAGCSLSEPQGGFVLWIQMPKEVNALALQEQAIANRIALMPGPLFSSSGKFQNCIRLNCGNAWTSEIDGAIRKLGNMVHEAASHPQLEYQINQRLRLVG